jgi:short subunit dehydrogenase-like uncharacterized protein
MSDRTYDVILYGASGFVGTQTVEYFAHHCDSGVRWAIAGRKQQKLEVILGSLGEKGQAIPVLVANSQNQTAIDEIVSQTKVLLNTAGPFARYGTPIVDACVRFKTHYVDITGETPWVKSLIDRYHNQAATDGTRIIPCCGFDSVPSDLGAYLVVRHMQQAWGVPCHTVKAYFQAMGGFNGGTLASAFNLYDTGQIAQVSDLFLLNPTNESSRAGGQDLDRDPLLPAYDADIGSWVSPFFMGIVNTRVVRRSAALYQTWQQPYGPNFAYQEYLKFASPTGWLPAAGITAATALFTVAMQQPALRHWLHSITPQPGSGPSEEVMDNGWFRCQLLATASDGRRVKGVISDQGDPGNRATVKFLCESALSLLASDALPGGQQRGGILTPATGLGEVLADRLRQAGMTLETVAIGS